MDVGGGIAVGVLSRDVSAWIPAFAGMTNGGVCRRTRKPFKGIPDRSPGHALVPMTRLVAGVYCHSHALH